MADSSSHDVQPSRAGEGADKTTTPRFSVVVPVFNEMALLPKSIPTVAAAVEHYGNAHLILVDNESTDGSFEYLQETLGDLATVLRFSGGPVGAVRNHGVAASDGELLCFLDADCQVPIDYLSRALAAFGRPDAGAVGSRHSISPDATTLDKTWHALHVRLQSGPVLYVPSGNLCVRASVFREIGGFDPAVETGEDAELCQRIRGCGYKVYEDQTVPAVHLGTPGTVSRFFKRETWHGLGMFGTFSLRELDRPTLGLFAFMGALGVGAAVLALAAVGTIPWALATLVAVVAFFSVPAASLAYRYAGARTPFHLGWGLTLYVLYYFARLRALAQIFGRKLVRGASLES